MHFIFFLLLSCTTAAAAHSRRTLHQPFFPQESPIVPPTSSPTPSPPSTSIPFIPTPTISSTTSPPNDKPFFPSVTSPPPSPPSPSSSVSFPANISSLDLPTSPKSKPVSSKLIVITVTLVIAAAIVISIVVILRILKRRRYYQDSQTFSDGKTQRSYSNSRAVFDSTANGGRGGVSGGANSNYNRIPKLARPSQTSSEFLYLGTLVNSHGGIDATNTSGRDNTGGEDSKFEKLGSPELHPLPPLGGGYGDQKRYSQNILRNISYETSEVESSKDEEMEEFYSPRESIGTGSGSRGAFPAVATGNYESRRIIGSGSSSSYSPSSLGSGSPARSVSLSISPPVSLSPIRPRPKSPDLVAIQTAPPPPSRPAPPPPPPPLPKPLIIPSPEVSSSKNSLESSPTLSNSSSQHNSPPPPARIPPPPPPPPKHRESPTPSLRTPSPEIRLQPLLKPPVLITPTRHVTVSSDHPLISPIELLPENQENLDRNEETHKPKLKPLHWDKVRASSDREMVWDQIKSSSFILNEEMIETLFIVKTPNSSNSNETSAAKRQIFSSPTSHENRVLDPKKSQNIAISLRALNVTVEEVCEALLEGNADTLGTELLESLLKMAPTKEEERKLSEYRDDSPFKLGPAEKFLMAVLDVPFAFKRVDAMLYISNFDSEVEYLQRSFQTLEAACEELRNSRMFLKLLEAVLKTGNRMNIGTNRGDAQAFKLDTLLKLVDVKGTDGKTTLLHFVVQEIIRIEGARLSNNHPKVNDQKVNDDAKCRNLGLEVVSGLTSDLSNVKKAATMDSEVLNGDVTKLSKGISNILEVVRLNETFDSGKVKVNTRNFSESMNRFMKRAEEEIIKIQAQESVALSLVKEITEYFHGNSAKEEAHPFRIFMVVRDFLTVLDRVCKEVGAINERIVISSAHKFPVPVNPTLPPVFNGFPARRRSNSSDEENSS